MWKLMNGKADVIKIWIRVIIILIIIFAIFCAFDAYGKTWTIDDGIFKSVYENREECIKANLGIGKTKICDDNHKVIYINR